MKEEELHKLAFHHVLPLLLEAEDAAWRSGDQSFLKSQNTERVPEIWDTLPNTILRHGCAVWNIHSYFSNLESRKCCLNLAARQTTIHSVRLIGNGGIESIPDTGDSQSHLPNVAQIDHLGDKDYAVYSQALLCADYPILCAPIPPTANSPMLSTYPRRPRRGKRLPYHYDVGVPMDTDDMMTSGVPSPEALCEFLRLAFGLTPQKAERYERLVTEQYRKRKKSRDRVLAEELTNQLALLDNNKHPFYNQRHFITADAYKLWKNVTIKHIGDLINKFWHEGLPHLKGSQHSDPRDNHENYRLLMEKLLSYETSTRGEHMRTVLSSSLSSASLRLLQEFGLRYGVGEVYRRAVYLAYLVNNFENEIWYLKHLSNLLVTITEVFPPNRNRVIMVREEWNMLKRSVELLRGECKNSLTKVKRLFPGQSPKEGVGCLLELLTNVLELEACLLDEHHVPVKELLMNYTQMNVEGEYRHHKMVALTDLKLDPLKPPTPKLMNRIISCIRDEVQDYSIIYRPVYQNHFDVVLLAAQSFYRLLMKDVQELLNEAQIMQTEGDFELRMLSLAYRLNQLDKDWAIYIPIGEQKWKLMFKDEVMRWLDVLQSHSQQLLMQAIGADRFIGLDVDETDERFSLPPSGSRSASSCSVTQSEGSAFEAVRSPTHLVQQDCRAEGSQEPSLRDWLTESMKLEAQHIYKPKGLFSRPQAKSEVFTETSFIVNEMETSLTISGVPSCLFSGPGPTKESGTNISPSELVPSEENRLSDLSDDGQGNFKELATENIRTKKRTTSRQLSLEPRPENFSGSSASDLSSTPELKKSVSETLPNISIQEEMHSSSPEANIEKSNGTDTLLERSVGSQVSAIVPQTEECNQEEKDIESVCMISKRKNREQGNEDSEQMGEYVSETLKEEAKNQKEYTEENCNDSQDESSGRRLSTGEICDLCKQSTEQRTDKSVWTNGESTHPNEGIPKAASGNVDKIVTAGVMEEVEKEEQPSRENLESCSSVPDESTIESLDILSGNVPVSGSLVDVICLVRRVMSFGKILSDTIFPIHCQDSQVAPCESLLPHSEENSNDNMKESILRARLSVYRKIMQMLSSLVCLYADNLLCYDLCGTRDKDARQIAGHQLIDRIKLEYQESHIWGCRHMAHGVPRCDMFVDRRSRNLMERHESMSEEMTLRINNLLSLEEVLREFFDEAISILDFNRMRELALEFGFDKEDDLIADFVIIDDISGSQSLSPVDQMGGESHRRSSQFSFRSSSPDGSASAGNETDLIFRHCKFHLRLVRAALINLLAFRVNLYFRDFFSQNLKMGLPMVHPEVHLQPLKVYLDWHLATLQHQLYDKSYVLLIKKLWRHTSQNFMTEVGKLTKNPKRKSIRPEILLQAIAYFMRYFRTKGLNESSLSQAVEKPLYWLELHTCSTDHLVSLYRILAARSCDQTGINQAMPNLPVEFLQKMRTALHGESKCFPGSRLVHWVMTEGLNNCQTDEEDGANDLLSDITIDENSALDLAQKLLDQGVIRNVEDDVQGACPRPEPIPNRPYPDLSMDSYSLPRAMTVESQLDQMGIHSAPSHGFYHSDSSSSEDDTSSKSSVGSQTGFYMVNDPNQEPEGNLEIHENDPSDTQRSEQHAGVATECDTSTSGTPLSYESGNFQHSPMSFYRFSSVCEVTWLQQHAENQAAGDTILEACSVRERNFLDCVVDMHKYYGVTPEVLLEVLSKRAMSDRQAKHFLKNVTDKAANENRCWLQNSNGFFWCFRC